MAKKSVKEEKEFPWDRLREIFGVLLIFLGIFVLIALLENPFNLSFLGAAGMRVAETLTLIFGGYVAYIVPVIIIFLSVCLVRQTLIPCVWTRCAGMIMLILSLCMLLALLPPYDIFATSDQDVFRAGGIIGNFFVHH